MNRAQIVADLKKMIGPTPGVDDSGLGTWVDDAYAQVIDAIIQEQPDYFKKSATTSSVLNQQEYELPSDFEKVAMVNIQIDGVWKRVMPMGDADIRMIPRHSDTTSGQGFSWANPQYYIYNNIIGFMPIPAESTSNNIKVWYIYTPESLSADSSTPAIPSRYHHILKFWAYANWLDQNGEHVAAERMRLRFDERVQKLVDNLRDKQVDETKSVQVTNNQDLYYSDYSQEV